MTEDAPSNLPQLPKPTGWIMRGPKFAYQSEPNTADVWGEHEMRAYARAAVLADRAGQEQELQSRIAELESELSWHKRFADECGEYRAGAVDKCPVCERGYNAPSPAEPDQPVAEVIIGGNGHIGILPLAELEHEQPLYARPRIKELMAQERQRKSAEPQLHPATADLVARFSAALADKLAAAEKKYGYSDGWQHADWMDECRVKLLEHVAKGDPRDVAAYCAFLWHHGESTAAAPNAQEE